MSRPMCRLFTQRLGAPLRAHLAPTSRTLRAPAARRFASGESGPNPNPGQNPFKVWPFVAITLLGTGSYILMARSRDGSYMTPDITNPQTPRLPAPKQDTPRFSPTDVTVVFVLGGPGAGKGTQCAKLVDEYHFTHLSAGDLLRAEQERPGSEFGELIKEYIRDGKIVPMEVTVQLLENAMAEVVDKSGGKGKFLIDGFPRKMDQAEKFEESVVKAAFVLFFDAPEDVMMERLVKRGETSGRSDDNVESIRKRFRVFVETSMPVVDRFEKEGRVVRVKATQKPEKVYEDVKSGIAPWIKGKN
ncbi:hypothetical protein V500_08309 [Pseudogymnoascus sp. VKM F-4518 (FW-2643)]|nr:hypothetical protein V500_08309 [Pseudogymnoascus sp. VKM F-4518 (FW-2643)]